MSKTTSRCLEFMNYTAILVGFTSLRIDYNKQKVYESRIINFYVVIVNIITLVLLPCAHGLSIKYITVNFKNNLLAFTDLVNMFIVYAVVVFSVVSRLRRERIYKEISQDIFKLDRSYFNKLKPNALIEKHANVVIVIKMVAVCLELFVPIFGILNQVVRVDVYVWMLALYTCHIESILHAVLFLFFYMLWQVQRRMLYLNARLKELLHSLQQLHESAAGILSADSGTLQQLSALAEEEMREISGVYARLTTMLLRLNSVYRWQVIVVLLTYLISNIAYGYFWVVSLSNPSSRPQNVTSIVSLLASGIVFIDINLLYWGADAVTNACQDTGQILRRFQVLPLMSAAFERQCETFALQLKQQKMNISIAGMFTLNRQTSVALWAFSVRHIVILMQFDYEARRQSNPSSGVLEHINHMLQFGDDYTER